MKKLMMLSALALFGCERTNPYASDPSAPGAPFVVRGTCQAIDNDRLIVNTQDGRDCACPLQEVSKAFTLMDGSGLFDFRQLEYTFTASTVWLFHADDAQSPKFSSSTESDPEWTPRANYDAGQIELETYALGLEHELIHQYEMTALGKTLEQTMDHSQWPTNGYAELSENWKRETAGLCQ